MECFEEIESRRTVGGASSEHEVSRMSATSVLNNLDTEKYDVLPVGITKDGRWYLYSALWRGPLQRRRERHSGNVPAAICPGSGLAGLVALKRRLPQPARGRGVSRAAQQNGEDGNDTGSAGWPACPMWAAACWAARGVHG